jgi:hypothetical protein
VDHACITQYIQQEPVALGLECREGDLEVIELLKPLVCLKSTIRCLAEREFMKALKRWLFGSVRGFNFVVRRNIIADWVGYFC